MNFPFGEDQGERESLYRKRVKVIDWEKISLEDLAGFLSEEFRKNGIDIILVGGACATLYSHNRYQSYDLDFVTYEDMKKVKLLLKTLGFSEQRGYFRHKHCQWIVEFVSPPIAIGSQPVIVFHEKKVALGMIKMLRVEDSVKDRLASYFHWNDKQGLEQAISICEECDVDYEEIRNWSVKEGFIDKFQEFQNKLQNKRK